MPRGYSAAAAYPRQGRRSGSRTCRQYWTHTFFACPRPDGAGDHHGRHGGSHAEFLAVGKQRDIALDATTNMLRGIGMTDVITSRGIYLSIGAVLTLSGVAFAAALKDLGLPLIVRNCERSDRHQTQDTGLHRDRRRMGFGISGDPVGADSIQPGRTRRHPLRCSHPSRGRHDSPHKISVFCVWSRPKRQLPPQNCLSPSLMRPAMLVTDHATARNNNEAARFVRPSG